MYGFVTFSPFISFSFSLSLSLSMSLSRPFASSLFSPRGSEFCNCVLVLFFLYVYTSFQVDISAWNTRRLRVPDGDVL